MSGNVTPEQFKQAMQKLANKFGGDEEAFHAEADDLICNTLEKLGFKDGIEIFRKQPKWYS